MDPQVEVKIETGFMVMKDGKAWGCIYADGRSTGYGWCDAIYATVHRVLKKPTDLTHKGSSYIEELSKAKVVKVTKRTIVIVEEVK